MMSKQETPEALTPEERHLLIFRLAVFAAPGRFPDVIAAVARLSGVPVDTIRRYVHDYDMQALDGIEDPLPLLPLAAERELCAALDAVRPGRRICEAFENGAGLPTIAPASDTEIRGEGFRNR